MDQNVFFTVVIPTYNREKFIVKTLESVFSQTYQNFEIIVVDNCSTDNTIEKLRPYANDKRIQLIQHDQNYERARSRNTGMENAKGDFLTFLDSDDLLKPSFLRDAVEFVADNPEFQCFHSLCTVINSDGDVVYNVKYPKLDNRIKSIASGNFMACIGNFISREIYQSYRFDLTPEIIGVEDWEFWLRVIADHEVGRIEEYNTLNVHHRGRSVSNQDLDSLQKGYEVVIRKFSDDQHLSGVFGKYLDSMEANGLVYLAILANSYKDFSRALTLLRRAVRIKSSIVFQPRFIRVLQIALFRIETSRD